MPAITLTLQSVINLASTHAELLPLANVGGYANEPALSICNDSASEIINDQHDWKWNSVEMGSVSAPLITMTNKQDYKFAGATAFVLAQNPTSGQPAVQSSGASLDLATNSAITVGNVGSPPVLTVTVTTLEPHRFVVGNTVYLVNNTFTTGTASLYNATYTDNGNQTAWGNGFVITAVTATTFQFAAVTGMTSSDVGGAPGINNFGWLTGATIMELNNNTSPPNTRHLKARRELPRWSKCADPEQIAVMKDYGTGVILVRFYEVPSSAIWATNLIYQMAAPIFVSLTATWSPIPDAFGSVVRQAVLYRMYRYLNSPTAPAEYQKLQAEIQRAKGRDSAEESNVYLEPEDSLIDYGPYWTG